VAGPVVDPERVDQGTALARPRTVLAARAGPCTRHGPSPVALPVLVDAPPSAPHVLDLALALDLALPALVRAVQVA
jgi:hypothetical protein